MKFAYDNITDSILIFGRKANEKIKGSAKIGNLILDITTEGKIVGMEIRKATEFFNTIGVEKSPEEINTANLSVEYKSDGLVIFLQLKFKNKEEEKVPIFVSSTTPHFATA